MTLRFRRVDDLAPCLAIRRAVFVAEQGILEALEFEGDDDAYEHWLAGRDGRPVVTLRLRVEGGTATIGRVASTAEARGTGAAAALMRHVLDELRRRGVARAELGAQLHATGFYERFGFSAFGPTYDDAGIPHRRMACAL